MVDMEDKPAVGLGAQHSLYEAAVMASPPLSGPRRNRPLSLVSKKPNRMSISFPVQPSGMVPSGTQESLHTPAAPLSISTTPEAAPSPQYSGSFMVALAAQERRVFELKEELNRAEADLRKLKEHWAVHEANKKRAEIKRKELEPHRIAEPSRTVESVAEIEAVARRSAEVDRRKAILAASINKESGRKVITGGHTRTLSLLSPDRSPRTANHNIDSLDNWKRNSCDTNLGLPRTKTMPDTTVGLSKISSERARHSIQGTAASGVKQIAEDLRAGIWTFMEDLRQATVGEEAVMRPSIISPMGTSRKSYSKLPSSGNSTNSQSDRSRSPTAQKATSNPCGSAIPVEPTSGSKVRNSSPELPHRLPSTPPRRDGFLLSSSTIDEDWSNWESPSPETGSSGRRNSSTTFRSDAASDLEKHCEP